MKAPGTLLLCTLVACCTMAPICVYAQWSTSTLTQNALYVCPGFSPSIISFDDGSSIIAGGLTDDIFLGKLDEYGYPMWPQPVHAHHNDSTDNPGGARLVPDGSGGVIMVWGDQRGSSSGENGYYNNALYIQRVDGSGTVRWQAGGIQLAPAYTGLKGALPVTDGAGGSVFIVIETDYDHPGAANIERLWGARCDSNGTLLWRRMYDSSTVRGSIQLLHVVRIGSRIYTRTLGGTLVIDLDGEIHPPLFAPGSLISEGDSVGYNLRTIGERTDTLGRRYLVKTLAKISANGDSLWSSLFETADEAPNGYDIVQNGLSPDGLGGVFFVWAYPDSTGQHRTRAQRIDRSGAHWPHGGLNIVQSIIPIPWAFAARGSLGIYFQTNAVATKFDTAGTAIWPQPVTVLSNPGEAYFVSLASDNRGGAIIIFWTTLGGIFAQHTGRNGQVGIITIVQDLPPVPLSTNLLQNYPNPFNPSTTITYVLGERGHVMLKVFDLLGREIATLVDRVEEPGYKSVRFDAGTLSSGMYFYRLQTGTFAQTRKLLVVK